MIFAPWTLGCVVFMNMRRLALPAFALLLAWTAPQAGAARSHIVVDAETGHILASGDPNQKVQVASLTKIATAMVVMDWADATRSSLANAVTVPEGINSVSGVNPCGLQPGDKVSCATCSMRP